MRRGLPLFRAVAGVAMLAAFFAVKCCIFGLRSSGRRFSGWSHRLPTVVGCRGLGGGGDAGSLTLRCSATRVAN